MYAHSSTFQTAPKLCCGFKPAERGANHRDTSFARYRQVLVAMSVQVGLEAAAPPSECCTGKHVSLSLPYLLIVMSLFRMDPELRQL